jgi:hypothetical protein
MTIGLLVFSPLTQVAIEMSSAVSFRFAHCDRPQFVNGEELEIKIALACGFDDDVAAMTVRESTVEFCESMELGEL